MPKIIKGGGPRGKLISPVKKAQKGMYARTRKEQQWTDSISNPYGYKKYPSDSSIENPNPGKNPEFDSALSKGKNLGFCLLF